MYFNKLLESAVLKAQIQIQEGENKNREIWMKLAPWEKDEKSSVDSLNMLELGYFNNILAILHASLHTLDAQVRALGDIYGIRGNTVWIKKWVVSGGRVTCSCFYQSLSSESFKQAWTDYNHETPDMALALHYLKSK